MSLLASTVESFFVERLMTQRNSSPRTIAAYRDALRLLLRFASEQTGKQPCRLEFADLDASLIGAFLNHLEHQRGNSITTRNARLAAIHSLYRYSALRHPEEIATIARVIEIPAKRHTRTTISYLEEKEIKALLRARTAPPGSAGATTRCCSPRSRPAFASRSSRACASARSASTPARTVACSAKACLHTAPPGVDW